jgi:hypothetical protein
VVPPDRGLEGLPYRLPHQAALAQAAVLAVDLVVAEVQDPFHLPDRYRAAMVILRQHLAEDQGAHPHLKPQEQKMSMFSALEIFMLMM